MPACGCDTFHCWVRRRCQRKQASGHAFQSFCRAADARTRFGFSGLSLSTSYSLRLARIMTPRPSPMTHAVHGTKVGAELLPNLVRPYRYVQHTLTGILAR